MVKFGVLPLPVVVTGIFMAFRWQADDGPTLNIGLVAL